MTRTALDIAQAHVERIAKAKAVGREYLAREAPDVLELADSLRERFGDGVRITKLEMKEKSDD